MLNSTTVDKQYYTVDTKEKVEMLVKHIQDSETIAYDTETNSLNMRKGSIVGFSVSGTVGVGYYLPTQVYNKETDTLDEYTIGGIGCHTIAKTILPMLIGKKLVMHNAYG